MYGWTMVIPFGESVTSNAGEQSTAHGHLLMPKRPARRIGFCGILHLTVFSAARHLRAAHRPRKIIVDYWQFPSAAPSPETKQAQGE
jgi:hypothetical protein